MHFMLNETARVTDAKSARRAQVTYRHGLRKQNVIQEVVRVATWIKLILKMNTPSPRVVSIEQCMVQEPPCKEYVTWNCADQMVAH